MTRTKSRVEASFIDGANVTHQVYVSEYEYDKTTKLNPLVTETEISFCHRTTEKVIPISLVVNPKILQSIEITKRPTATNYIEGQTFDKSGMEVTAHYEYIHETVDDYTVMEGSEKLLPTTTSVRLSYVKNGIPKTVEQSITVAYRTLERIEIVSSPAKVNYVQGQAFRKEGLRVTAYYDYGEQDITDEVELDANQKLTHSDSSIEVTYTENGKSCSAVILIKVNKPYEETRKIALENPLDVTISWLYSYMTDEDESKIDNTEISGHDGLKFDRVKGEYIVPVGATVTLLCINPAVMDFILGEKPCGLLYPANSFDFELEAGEELVIKFKRLPDKITVYLTGEENEQTLAFCYPQNWNTAMRASDLSKISEIFSDTESHYYEYAIGENTYTFAELSAVKFEADTLVKVKKVQRSESDLVTVYVMYSEVKVAVVLDRTESLSLSHLPQSNRIGYSLGFSLTEGGVLLTDSAFADWANTAKDGNMLYTVYTLNVAEQSGAIVGNWSWSGTNEGKTFALVIVFREDGTYEYTLQVDGEENCVFKGVYAFDGSAVRVFSVESKTEIQLIGTDDLQCKFVEGKLMANLLFVDGMTVNIRLINLTKVS